MPALDIYNVATEFATGRRALDDVQGWLVPRLGSFLVNDQAADAAGLAGLFELLFAEVASGETTEEEARQTIRESLCDVVVTTSAVPSATIAASSNTMYPPDFAPFMSWQAQESPAGTPRETAFAS